MISMRKIYIFFLGVLILFWESSCIDIISLDTPELNPQKIVIQASVKKGNPSLIEVYINQSAEFVKIASGIQISGASVKLLDEAQRSILIPEQKPGFYKLNWTNNTDFDIEVGKSYQLHVEHPDGNIYQSDFDRIHAVPEAKGINIGLETRDVLNEQENIITTQFIKFLMETSLKHPVEENKAYLKWDMEGVYQYLELPAPIPIPGPKTCYIYESIGLDKVNIFNGFETSTPELENHLLFEEPINGSYSVGYYLTVYQQSLSKTSYEYWEQVREVSAREGSLFESPPGKIKSNIYNINDETEQVLGYFYTTEIDTIRRLIRASDVNYPKQPCTGFTYEEAPNTCRNCLLWPNSTTRKPSFWVD